MTKGNASWMCGTVCVGTPCSPVLCALRTYLVTVREDREKKLRAGEPNVHVREVAVQAQQFRGDLDTRRLVGSVRVDNNGMAPL